MIDRNSKNEVVSTYNAADLTYDQPLRPKSYTPTATKSWTLAAFLTAVLACIALLEVASHTKLDIKHAPILIPLSASRRSLHELNVGGRHVDVHFLDLRQVSTTTSSGHATSQPPPGNELTNTSPTPTPDPTAGDQLTNTSPGLVASATGSTSIGEPPPGSQLVVSTPDPSITVATFVPTSGATAVTLSLPNGASTTILVPTMSTTTDAGITGSPTASILLTITYPAGPTNTPTAPYGGDELMSSETFSNFDYFLAVYLPTLLAVVLQSFWATIFAGVKMMEPFYRLSQPQGSSAKDTFFAEYLSPGLDLQTLTTMFGGHVVTLLSSITYLLISLVVSLSGESMTVKGTAYCKTPLSDAQPCSPKWFVDHSVVRGLEALLACIFMIVFAIIVLSLKRSSGISSDPSSIASMASLLGNSAVLDDLRSVYPLARSQEAKQALQHYRYHIGHYQDALGRPRYGLIKLSPHSAPQEVSTPNGWAPVPDRDGIETRPRSQMLINLRDVGFGCLILILFVIITAYYKSHGDNSFNNFFNSQTFGPRFVLSGIAVLINLGWKRLDQETRIMEPWRRMAQQPTRGDRSVVTSVASTPYSSICIAALQRHPFVLFISLIAVLGEMLVIVVNGIPLSGAQMQSTYLASTYVSMGILTIMIVAALAVGLRRRRGSPPIPRDPNTLANVWLYLCEGRLLDEQHEVDTLEDKQSLINAHKQTYYGFAYSTGVDGQRRWMIT